MSRKKINYSEGGQIENGSFEQPYAGPGLSSPGLGGFLGLSWLDNQPVGKSINLSFNYFLGATLSYDLDYEYFNFVPGIGFPPGLDIFVTEPLESYYKQI